MPHVPANTPEAEAAVCRRSLGIPYAEWWFLHADHFGLWHSPAQRALALLELRRRSREAGSEQDSLVEQRQRVAANPRNARPGRGERATDEFVDAIETARAVAGDDMPLLKLGPGGDFTREVRG